jgi:hypothetical protein
VVDLWRQAESIEGLLHACNGLSGDLPTGIIENQHFDRTSDRLSFDVRLTMGTDYLGAGRQVSSQDMWSFSGKLDQTRLTGTLHKVDRVYADNAGETEKVSLPRRNVTLPDYRTYAAWRQQAGGVLSTNGPKW